jgi:PAS domain S-box-containing protein
MKVFDLYADTPHGVLRAKALFARFQKGESIRDEELQMKRMDGKAIWVNLNVAHVRNHDRKIVESRSMVIDISKRKLSEDALRKSEKRYRLLVEAMNDGLGVLDNMASLKYLNDKFCEMLGYQGDEIIGRPIADFFPESEQTIFENHFARRKKMESTRYEMTFIRKDGREIPTIVSGAPIFDDGKRFKGAFAVVTDISDRKKMETELETRASDLEEISTALKVLLKRKEQDKTELLNRKSKLKKINKELLETNRAVSVLARNIDKNRQEMESTIAMAINSQIMPIVKDLRKAKNLEKLQADLDILAANLQSLTSDLTGGVNLITSLTPTEMRIATMIKNGLKSQAIADKLYISLHTAKTHRRNIRKKLNVNHSRINLASYLQSIMW